MAPINTHLPPSDTMLRPTLAAPPGMSSRLVTSSTGTGLSGEIRLTSPVTKRSSMTSPMHKTMACENKDRSIIERLRRLAAKNATRCGVLSAHVTSVRSRGVAKVFADEVDERPVPSTSMERTPADSPPPHRWVCRRKGCSCRIDPPLLEKVPYHSVARLSASAVATIGLDDRVGMVGAVAEVVEFAPRSAPARFGCAHAAAARRPRHRSRAPRRIGWSPRTPGRHAG